MKLKTLLVLLVLSVSAIAQEEYTIRDFSTKYIGKLTIDQGQEDHVFKKGTIVIYSKSSNKKLIEIKSEELIFDLDDNKEVKTNVLELPYEEQSILISQDFNFDGTPDIAIMDGQHSCYHGPSFQIYLDKNNELVHSKEFTRLGQEYCGLFKIDEKNKTIHTMTKSGCCWHQFSTFKVIEGIPKPVLVIEEDAMNLPYLTTTTRTWDGDTESETIEKYIDLEEEETVKLFSFELQKNRKKVIVFTLYGTELNYILLTKDKVVEFNYPLNSISEDDGFLINKTKEELTFKNKDATYQVYDKQSKNGIKEVGVLITVKGKTYDLKGDIKTVKGTLKNIDVTRLNNLTIE
nr:hypothetical protein [Aquimarina sp. I32.4]